MSINISRRAFLEAGALTLLGTTGIRVLGQMTQDASATPASQEDTTMSHEGHGMPTTVGEVDHERNGFNPTEILTDFDYGNVTILSNGQTLREYDILVTNKDVEITPGMLLPCLGV